jgi:hypothetical protein
MTLIPLANLVVIVLVALGLSAVITGSKIGFPIRFLYCRITWAIHPVLHHSWGLVRCPYCNAWWSAAAIALMVYGWSWWILQAAFTACGLVRVVQAILGGDGIAMVEDFQTVFEGEDNG